MKYVKALQEVMVLKNTEEYQVERKLLSLNDFCKYMGIGKTKAREMLKAPRNGFAIKIGSKWFVYKDRLDEWILSECDKY